MILIGFDARGSCTYRLEGSAPCTAELGLFGKLGAAYCRARSPRLGATLMLTKEKISVSGEKMDI